MAPSGHGELAIGAPALNQGPASERIPEALPYLRRYARAISGSQGIGDALVRATLNAVQANPDAYARHGRSRIQLYRTFTEIWNSADVDRLAAPGAATSHDAATASLVGLSPIQRQALVLIELEEFSLADAGRILGLSLEDTAALVEQAMLEVAQDRATEVLVVEDEPLISSHLEAILEDMGHRVVAVAATAGQADAACAAHRPGLVLADIQLADGSSGLAAVANILAAAAIPIVFITAFPEALLTGDRPEPSFLVAKPFREDTLRIAVSQALFCAASARG